MFDSGFQDRAQAVAVDASSNVYVAGFKANASSGQDWVVLKLDPNGVLISSDSFDSAGGSSLDAAKDILIAGSNIIVVGKAGGLRHIRVYNTSLQLVGTYEDGYGGTFNAVISSGTNLITSTLDGSNLLVNEFTTGAGLTIIATHTMTGSYGPAAADRNLVRDGLGRLFVVGARSDTKVLRLERLLDGLGLHSFLEFDEPEEIVGGAAVAATPSGDVYSVAIGSVTGQSINHIYRTSGASSVLAGTTVTANGFISNVDERAVVIDPTNLDVYYAGSGPFPGILRFPSDLSVATERSFYPTSAMAILNGANMYATEVNQTGPQDYVVHKFDFNALSSGGGQSGQPALTNDGTSLYMSKKAGNGEVDLYKINPPSTLVASATLAGVGGGDNFPVAFHGGFLYMVGTASGPTTQGDDAAVWKIDPNTLLMVSSRTLEAGFGLGEYVMDATTTTGGLLLSGAVETAPGSFAVGFWQYNTGTDVLVLKATANAPGSNFDFASGIASTGTPATFWLVGYSSQAVGGGLLPYDVALWRYTGGSTLELMNTLPAFLPDTEGNPKMTATSGGLYVSAAKMNAVPDRDLAFIAFDLTGSTTAEKYWHSSSPSTHDKAAGLLVTDAGNIVVFGGQEPNSQTGYSAYWEYNPSGVLTSGYPKNFSTRSVIYAGTKMGSTLYGTNSGSATGTFTLDGTGTTVAGAEGAGTGGPDPLAFTFSGGPATSLKINSSSNQNEAGQFVFVDTTTGNFYLTWKSTSGSPGSEPDVASLGKFDASGTMLASTTLLGDRSGGAAVYLNGNVYIQERSNDYSILQFTKFAPDLSRVFSRTVSSLTVGNITDGAAGGGFIYVACDGAGTGAADIGAMKVIKYDSSLNEVARASYSNISSGFHHNAHSIALNVGGDVFVVVSTAEAGPYQRHIVKYDANLLQLSSANVTAHFPADTPQLAYAGSGFLYALGNTDPAVEQKVFLRKFDTGLAYANNSTTITVTGTSPRARLVADPANNAVVTLTSSTADGGDFITFRFDNNLVQLSSGQFDAGFNGADSGLSGVAVDTTSVYLSGMGGNGGHKDAVVMKRSLPGGAAAGGGGDGSTFSGNFSANGGATFDGGFEDSASAVVVDTFSVGGPFVYSVGTASHGVSGNDWFVIKYDASGVKLASATYDGTPSWGDSAYAAALDGAGNLIVTGQLGFFIGGSGSPGCCTGNNIFTIKYAPSLAVLSSATYNDPGNGHNVPKGVAVGAGGSIYIVGHTTQSTIPANDGNIALKYDSNLVLQASATLASPIDSNSNSWRAVTALPSGDLVVAGNIFNGSDDDVVTARYSAGLGLISSATLIGANKDKGQGVGVNAGGDVFVVGVSSNGPASNDLLLVKFNSSLSFVSSTSFNGALGANDEATGLSLDAAGNLLVSAQTDFKPGIAGGDIAILQFNPSLVFVSSDGYSTGIEEGGNAVAVGIAPYVYSVGYSFTGISDEVHTIRRSFAAAGGGAPASPLFTAAGAYVSAGGNVISATGFNSIGRNVFVDTVTVSGPFVYVSFLSTTGAIGGGDFDPEVDSIARLNASGTLLSSATLPGNSGIDGLVVDGAFNVYLPYKVKVGTITMEIGVVKYDKFLTPLAQTHFLAPTSGTPAPTNITRMTGDGTNIYLANDGASLIKMNSSLVAIATASYTSLPGFTNSNAVTLDAVGNVYMEVNDATTTIHLLKYGASFDGASPLIDVTLSTALFPILGNGGSFELAYAGGSVFVLAADPLGDKVYIRKFDSSLNYTGISSTYTPTRLDLGPGQMKTGPDGNLYVVTAASKPEGSTYAALVYDTNLNLLDSQTFDPSTQGGSAVGLAVPAAGDVWATGTSCNGGGGSSCEVVTTRFALSAAAGPVANHQKGASEFVIAQNDDNEQGLSAAYGSGKLLVAYQVQTGTHSENNRYYTQLVNPNGSLSGSPLALSTATIGPSCGMPSVASDGTDFLLVASCNGREKGRLISGANAPIGGVFDIDAGALSFNTTHAAAAFDGTNYLV
ncbi:hypothetical protein EPO15_13635, partial [bacterium]